MRKLWKRVLAGVLSVSMVMGVSCFGTGSKMTLAATGDSVTYDFRDGSIIPTDTDGKSNVTTTDGNLTVKVGTKNAYLYNGAQHGVAFKDGNSVEIKANGPTKVTVGDCQYSNSTSLTLQTADGSWSQTVANKTGCYHNDGSAVVFKYPGEAATLVLNFDNTTYVPVIIVTEGITDVPDDNGVPTDSILQYNFVKGEIVPKTCDSENRLTGSVSSKDGFLTVSSNGNVWYHDTQHGLAVYNGDTMDIKVAGEAIVEFVVCQYGSASGGVWQAKCDKGEFISATELPALRTDYDAQSVAFHYVGVATTLHFTLKGDGEFYLHGIRVTNFPEVTETPQTVGNGKVDVWDFAAAELDTEKYNNMLTVDIINGWYDASVEKGTSGKNVGTFATNDIVFGDGGRDNTHRIRTTNEAITRWDNKSKNFAEADGSTTELNGYIYSNLANNPGVYVGIKLYEGDILTVYTGSNGGAATISFESPSGSIQKGASSADGAKLTFYASEYGVYHLYTLDEKLVVYRMYREHTAPVQVSGTVTAPDSLKDYQLVFTNNKTGAAKAAEPAADGSYSIWLNDTYDYTLSLKNANGYVIKSDPNVAVTTSMEAVDVTVESVDLAIMTGKLTGLDEAARTKLKLSFVNPDYAYVPEFTVDGDAITVSFERGVTYQIVAENINDYYLSGLTEIKLTENKTQNIDFTAKPVYEVKIETTGVDSATWANAVVTLSNIKEAGYVYTFKPASEKVLLRDGQYTAVVTGLASPVAQKRTADVKVNGAATTAKIGFETRNVWDFSVLNKEFGGSGIETIGEGTYCGGLVLNGTVMENKTYLLVNPTGSVQIPVKKGDIVTAKYCYCAAFLFNNDPATAVDEKSGSTSQIDTATYIAKEDGYVTISALEGGVNSTQTYFTSISVLSPVPYKEAVTVGKDKDFTTINAALDYIAQMVRTEEQRVVVMIDPGNYEEMLVVKIPNVTLKNAAGANASIALTNKGVDIDKNAVRITSYYGHGYSYYSMDEGCKYDADLLEINKSNGYLGFKNPGSGTTSGSYWNATVCIFADGFEADGIIFENSFNQYISERESKDVVIMESGNKGERPTTVGDTSVQNKSFVERAAALAIGNKYANIYFNNCKFIGRQDTLYGGAESTVAFNKCDILGACDYIFGGMTAVFNECNLVLNTSEASSDVAYITAAQQSTTRGFLFYDCVVTSTKPGVDTASEYGSKPGYFGRPWSANTSEAVFINTTVQASDEYYGEESLIKPEGWLSSLGGESKKMYEYGTKELSGENNQAARASWSTVLAEPVLSDGTDVSTKEKAVAAFLGDWKPFEAAPTTPDTPPTPDTKPETWVYTVVKGDILKEIAKKAGCSIWDIAKLNNLENPDLILIGQKLLIPVK